MGVGITFLGLIAPHIARRLVGARHAKLLPLTAILGSLLLLSADTLGRVIMAPMELPVGYHFDFRSAVFYLLTREKHLIYVKKFRRDKEK